MIAYTTLKLQKEIKLSESNKEMNPVFFIIVELIILHFYKEAAQ